MQRRYGFNDTDATFLIEGLHPASAAWSRKHATMSAMGKHKRNEDNRHWHSCGLLWRDGDQEASILAYGRLW